MNLPRMVSTSAISGKVSFRTLILGKMDLRRPLLPIVSNPMLSDCSMRLVILGSGALTILTLYGMSMLLVPIPAGHRSVVSELTRVDHIYVTNRTAGDIGVRHGQARSLPLLQATSGFGLSEIHDGYRVGWIDPIKIKLRNEGHASMR